MKPDLLFQKVCVIEGIVLMLIAFVPLDWLGAVVFLGGLLMEVSGIALAIWETNKFF